MGYKYSFIDGEVYGTEDINGITSNLVGAGVAPFLSKNSYSVSDLNVLTSAITEPGVELGGCRCSGVYSEDALVGVNVAKGIVYFESGVCLTVDDEGAEIPVEKNCAGVVYAYFSPSLQFAKIEFRAELPDEGEYVILARVDEDGNVWDERSFARSKVATFGGNLTIEREFENIEPIQYESGWFIVAEISGVNLSQHNYIMVNKKDNDFYSFAFYDIKNDAVLISAEDPKQATNTVDNRGVVYSMNTDIVCYFKVMGGKPVIVARCRKGYEKYLSLPRFEAKIM